jgi:hypothetical protein
MHGHYWHDRRHPIWIILRQAVQLGGLSLLLLITATKFDGGEIKTIVGAGAVNLLVALFKRGDA